MDPYHPSGYDLIINRPTDENPDPEYRMKFQPGKKEVPDELVHGKEVEVQIDDAFQIFGHYKHPYLDFDNTELDIKELRAHVPDKITIWY